MSHRLTTSLVLSLCAVALAACSRGISVTADPADLIRRAAFIDVENLPVPVSLEDTYHQAQSSGVRLLPGSEPRRLLVAVFGNACRPNVTVAALDLTGPPQFRVAVSYPASHSCGEVLLMWPIEVTLDRDVDLARVILEVMGDT